MDQKPDGIFGVFEVVRDFYNHGISAIRLHYI